MWTPTTRQQHTRLVSRYQTDLTDAAWRVIAPHLPKPSATGRPREWPMREIINGIFYVTRADCPWRLLPNDLPPWGTIYRWFAAWRDVLFVAVRLRGCADDDDVFVAAVLATAGQVEMAALCDCRRSAECHRTDGAARRSADRAGCPNRACAITDPAADCGFWLVILREGLRAPRGTLAALRDLARSGRSDLYEF